MSNNSIKNKIWALLSRDSLMKHKVLGRGDFIKYKLITNMDSIVEDEVSTRIYDKLRINIYILAYKIKYGWE